MLEKLIQDDVSAAKTPVLLVGFAGTPFILQSIQFYVTIQYISCIFWLTAMRKILMSLKLTNIRNLNAEVNKSSGEKIVIN